MCDECHEESCTRCGSSLYHRGLRRKEDGVNTVSFQYESNSTSNCKKAMRDLMASVTRTSCSVIREMKLRTPCIVHSLTISSGQGVDQESSLQIQSEEQSKAGANPVNVIMQLLTDLKSNGWRIREIAKDFPLDARRNRAT